MKDEDILKKITADRVVFSSLDEDGDPIVFENVPLFLGQGMVMVLQDEKMNIFNGKRFEEAVLSGDAMKFSLTNNLISTQNQIQQISQMQKHMEVPEDGF